MAGRKMRSRKDNSHNRHQSDTVRGPALRKNKERKALYHAKKLDTQSEHSEARKCILEECMKKYNATSYLVKRLIGTPNARRLSALLNGTFITETWFKERTVHPRLKEKASGTGITADILNVMSIPVEENDSYKKVYYAKRRNTKKRRPRGDKPTTDPRD